MQPSVPTVHLLVAFHALTHRLSLTEDLKAEIAGRGASLSHELWRATVGLLHEADRGAPGTRVDIGFESLLRRWLGIDDARVEDVESAAPELIEHVRKTRADAQRLAAELEGR